MSELTQTVIVSAVAALALGVLVWPLVPGRKPTTPSKPGCASCSADHGAKPSH
jgi:uncharacterized membrane protein YdfJ with MMPL/SSD domain